MAQLHLRRVEAGSTTCISVDAVDLLNFRTVGRVDLQVSDRSILTAKLYS